MNGSVSDWASVKSGVPQGSVLGLILFVAFINDLPGAVSSMCAMYADGTKVHGPVNNSEDGNKLQKDLDALVEWADTWQLRFNADKCKILHMEKNNEKRCYKMRKHGSSDRVSLEHSEIERNLGVRVDKDLRFSQHIETQVNKVGSNQKVL